jgi:hypothetical protein
MASNHKATFTAAFDDKANRLLKDWHVPGLAIAIVDGSETHTNVL